MAEQVKPLSLIEAAHIALIGELKAEAEAQALADHARRFAVVCQQFGIADGTRIAIEPAIGPVPARMVYNDGREAEPNV